MIREILVQFLALPEGIKNSHFSPHRRVPQTIKMKHRLWWGGMMYFLSFERVEESISGSMVWAE